MAASLGRSFFLEADMRISRLFRTLLRDWVMNPCYHPDLYFREVTDEIIRREDFNELHDELTSALNQTKYAYHPWAELSMEEIVQEPAAQYDEPLPADYAGFSYHIPEQKWEQRALPVPFRRRIMLVLESNCPDYHHFYCALKCLLMYAFVPGQIKNRSITPHFKNMIEQIINLCVNYKRYLSNLLNIQTLAGVKGSENMDTLLEIIEAFEERLDFNNEIMEILRILSQLGYY